MFSPKWYKAHIEQNRKNFNQKIFNFECSCETVSLYSTYVHMYVCTSSCPMLLGWCPMAEEFWKLSRVRHSALGLGWSVVYASPSPSTQGPLQPHPSCRGRSCPDENQGPQKGHHSVWNDCDAYSHHNIHTAICHIVMPMHTLGTYYWLDDYISCIWLWLLRIWVESQLGVRWLGLQLFWSEEQLIQV